MARLDRLGSAEDVAQIGAAIGREFSHLLLAAVIPKPEADLRSALDRLIDAGLLFQQGVPPHATYLFKHALVQDAAYGTLLREPRRALHARIAETLEGQFADIAESQPELLARHYTEAGLIEKAVSFWRTAGQRSLARSALLEGAQQIKRALDQIAILPATPDLHGEGIKLHVAFANALTLTGNFVDGKEHYDRALAIYDAAEHRPLTTVLVGISGWPSWHLALGVRGCLVIPRLRAVTPTKRSKKRAKSSTLLHCCMPSGEQVIITSSVEITPLQLRRSMSFSVWQTKEEHRTGKHLEPPSGVGFLPRPEKPRMRFGRSPWGSPHFGQWSEQPYEPNHLQYLAMAYADLGRLHDAWRCIDDAIDKIEKSTEKWVEAEVHRIAGEIALKSLAPDTEKAENYFEDALSVARAQQAKSWELRAAMSLVRLWRNQGKPQQARELLAPIYGWFTEGFDTRDLIEAKALLEELA